MLNNRNRNEPTLGREGIRVRQANHVLDHVGAFPWRLHVPTPNKHLLQRSAHMKHLVERKLWSC